MTDTSQEGEVVVKAPSQEAVAEWCDQIGAFFGIAFGEPFRNRYEGGSRAWCAKGTPFTPPATGSADLPGLLAALRSQAAEIGALRAAAEQVRFQAQKHERGEHWRAMWDAMLTVEESIAVHGKQIERRNGPEIGHLSEGELTKRALGGWRYGDEWDEPEEETL